MSALAARTVKATRQSDGTVELVMLIEPDDGVVALREFNRRNRWLAVSSMNGGFYGNDARALVASGWFRNPALWSAVGTDAEFQAWARRQRCVLTGGFDFDTQKGEQRCDFCHVRRADGAGTGIKPEFSGVPMVHDAHLAQHQRGELAAINEYGRRIRKKPETASEAAQWFEAKAVNMAAEWAFETLKAQLGFESFSDVPPRLVKDWANAAGLAYTLPGVIRNAG